MAIEVKWFATLVPRTNSKQDRMTVDWRAGLTPRDVFMDEGFSEADAEAVMVVINDSQADMQTEMNDGDNLEFMVSIQGG